MRGQWAPPAADSNASRRHANPLPWGAVGGGGLGMNVHENWHAWKARDKQVLKVRILEGHHRSQQHPIARANVW